MCQKLIDFINDSAPAGPTLSLSKSASCDDPKVKDCKVTAVLK
jgi:hypothetical protein